MWTIRTAERGWETWIYWFRFMAMWRMRRLRKQGLTPTVEWSDFY